MPTRFARKIIVKILFLFVLLHIFANGEAVKLIKSGGTYSVPVTINSSVRLNFVVDSGASDVTIPFDVFSTLMRTGTITKKDILDEKKYEMANGEIEKYYTFNIRKLQIGNQYISNIRAAASRHMKGGLLLGQSALKKLEPWRLDTVKNKIYIKENKTLSNSKPRKDNKIGSTSERAPEEIAYAFSKHKKLCDNGNAKGCFNLAYFYRYGDGMKQNIFKAVELYRRACDSGYAKGCFELGFMYNYGKEIKQNNFTAVKLYKKACNAGYVDACYYLGHSYSTGNGIKQNFFKAFKLFKKACNAGKAGGCENVGVMYKYGRGVKQNNFTAFKYFKKACSSGYPDGCLNLGYSYLFGEGVKQDNYMAKEYFGRACDGGVSLGCKMYADLNK